MAPRWGATIASPKSLLTGIFTGILGKIGPEGRFSPRISLAFSAPCARKSLLNGTGISFKAIREFPVPTRERGVRQRAAKIDAFDAPLPPPTKLVLAP
jgi:hypothetical protein